MLVLLVRCVSVVGVVKLSGIFDVVVPALAVVVVFLPPLEHELLLDFELELLELLEHDDLLGLLVGVVKAALVVLDLVITGIVEVVAWDTVVLLVSVVEPTLEVPALELLVDEVVVLDAIWVVEVITT